MTRFQTSSVAAAVALLTALAAPSASAQAAAAPADAQPAQSTEALPTVTVRASADASAQGLSPAYAGGQVARGGRAGILGTRDNMDTPFSITAYTNELIQDRQARSVGDVLQNDPTVRVARGFGNFQESYFIRGFVLFSDDVAYNGLYNLLPRQYIATELFERVEVLRGASASLNGANPNGSGIGGAINLLPKRAPNEPLNRLNVSLEGNGSLGTVSADIARRFGPDQSTGLRVNAALRDGSTHVEREYVSLGLVSVGMDWRSRDVRLSGDIGYQDHKLRRTRTNVTLGTNAAPLTTLPSVPDNEGNWAQDWSYSNERDVFGTLRGEYDISDTVTAWAAYGARRGQEANSLANVTVSNGATGAASTSRFDNAREDRVDTGEVGLRAKLRTGGVGHELVASYAMFQLKKYNAYALGSSIATNIYRPVRAAQPAFTFLGNDLSDPAYNGKVDFESYALVDTLALFDDRLLVTIGARHQQLKTEGRSYTTRSLTTGVIVPGRVNSSYDESRTSPLLGVVFKVAPKFSVYGNYVESLAQGQTAAAATGGPTPLNNGEIMAPYVSRQKEVGVKYDGGRLSASAALFSTSKPRAFINSALVFATQGEDKHQGLELTVQGVAMRGLRLLGGATWLDAKQEKTGVASTEGKQVIGVPRFQSTIGAEWDVPGARGVALDGRLIHTGGRYVYANNTLKAPSWTRVDIGARYITDIQGRAVTLRARIENLADRDYWASVGGSPDSGYLAAGAPRTLGVSASVDF
ncbi:TonB-dependent receptor [Aquabacterium soli]|uniref:TonB-dependent receptor n=1 Tax=Aquabacterium soli TaxID=2493092 RepID=A0A3R8TWD5_9BURK|nr:TonB-dependent receptor [Aquabacterium soli]RRS06242.1 TonB-dependent receptor [Aquabacterium soli]